MSILEQGAAQMASAAPAPTEGAEPFLLGYMLEAVFSIAISLKRLADVAEQIEMDLRSGAK